MKRVGKERMVLAGSFSFLFLLFPFISVSFLFFPFLSFSVPFISFSFVIMPLHSDKAYNMFLDEVEYFIDDYLCDSELGDNDPFVEVAKHIVKMLMRNHHLPRDDPFHPFKRYGNTDESEGEYANLNRLAADAMNEIQAHRLRSAVSSFFHSEGAGRESVEELLDQFWIYSATSQGVSVEDDEDDSDDEEEDNSLPIAHPQYSSPNGVIYID